VDVEKYLVAETLQKLEGKEDLTVDDVIQSTVETVLENLDNPPVEQDLGNIVQNGLLVWLTLADRGNTTLKDVKDFVAKAETMAIEDTTIVQGSLELSYPVDPTTIWKDS
jgi:hypothetical protein